MLRHVARALSRRAESLVRKKKKKKNREEKSERELATTMAARGVALKKKLPSSPVFPPLRPLESHPSTLQNQATRSLSTTSASASKELSFDVR